MDIVWREKALKELESLEVSIARRIIKSVNELSKNPFSKDVKKLIGFNGFRLRVGSYRIIFNIDGNTINILKVGHRKNVYK